MLYLSGLADDARELEWIGFELDDDEVLSNLGALDYDADCISGGCGSSYACVVAVIICVTDLLCASRIVEAVGLLVDESVDSDLGAWIDGGCDCARCQQAGANGHNRDA